MNTIDINGKKYVPVEERLLDLAETFPGNYSIKTSGQFFPVDRMFVAHAIITIHSPEREFHGLCNKKLGDNGFAESALSWAETIAVGRAYSKGFPERLRAAGAEIVSAEEVEKPTEAIVPIVKETLDKIDSIKAITNGRKKRHKSV